MRGFKTQTESTIEAKTPEIVVVERIEIVKNN